MESDDDQFSEPRPRPVRTQGKKKEDLSQIISETLNANRKQNLVALTDALMPSIIDGLNQGLPVPPLIDLVVEYFTPIPLTINFLAGGLIVGEGKQHYPLKSADGVRLYGDQIIVRANYGFYGINVCVIQPTPELA